MKRKSTRIKEKLKELHDWQMIVRMDISALKASVAKAKAIADELRKIQSEKS